ncbi:MAG: YbhN family protein [bacterium]
MSAGPVATTERAVEPAAAAVRVRWYRHRRFRLAVSLILVGVSIGIVSRVPHLTGSTWTDVVHNIRTIGSWTAVEIGLLWIGGLIVYSIAMVSSMPGLSHKRAIALNLAGSSAANLLPFGGVVGTGINVAMVRSWQLSVRGFASSTAVLNVVNLVTKLLLPVIAGVVISNQAAAAPWLGNSAYVASALAATVVVVLVCSLIFPSWARRLDRMLNYVTRRFSRRRSRATAGTPDGNVMILQRQVREVFRDRWLGLTAGMIGYIMMQWALFALCLHAAGVGAHADVVFAAFAVERALTLAVVTPAGTGLAEAAATGLLVALGFPAAASATGVLLYRLFVYVAEIPVGMAVLGTWAARRTLRRERRAGEIAAASAAASSAAAESDNAQVVNAEVVDAEVVDAEAVNADAVDAGSTDAEPSADPSVRPERQPEPHAVKASASPTTSAPPTASRR